MSNVTKDANAVVLTDEVRRAIEDGGAVRMNVPLSLLRWGNNPRKRKGFDPESMRDLQETIALDGLLKNILVRQIVDPENPAHYLFEIVAGERRTRAIHSLVEEDREVKDLTTGRMTPASQVYATVPALVQGSCDDNTATRLAFLENDQHVPLSDADVIDLCMTLEAQGKTRKEISDLLRKSQAWLSHTFGFLQRLTPVNYEKLRAGEINRSVAVKLMDYEAEVQVPIIEVAKEIATERHKATKKKIDTELDEAAKILDQAIQEKLELAHARADERSKKLAETKVDSAEKKAKKVMDRKKVVEETIPTPSQSDVAEAAFRVTGAAHGNKNLNSSQINQHFIDKAKNLMAIAEGDPVDIKTGNHFFRRDLELTVVIAEAIATGNRDYEGVLRQFYMDKKTWDANGKLDGTLVTAVPTPSEDIEPDEDDDFEENFDMIDTLNFDDDQNLVGAGVSAEFGGIDLASLDDDDD